MTEKITPKKVKAQGRIWTAASLKSYRKYQNQFIKEHYKAFILRVSIEKDSDIIEKLSACSNITGYLKDLIREDIKKNG